VNNEVTVSVTDTQHRFASWDQLESEGLHTESDEVCTPDGIEHNIG
jgi:hypothetical protein